MSNEDKKYNGWTNYETWCVNLWMSNDQGSDEYYREMAEETYKQSSADGSFTRAERATLDLMRRLKDEFEEAQPELGCSMWSDLLNAAMSEVNWYEIASHYIADVDKEEETSK